MTDTEVNQLSQTLSNVFIALQNMNMPMTENNLNMMNVAQSNVKGVIGFLKEKLTEMSKKDNQEETDKIDENKK